MAILKNILETSTEFKLLFERDEYITDPLKTKPNLIGALCCSAQNFPNVCRALKRYSGQRNSKMLRHFVVSISPIDEGKLSGEQLLDAAREVAMFFKDCYVKYAIHTNTPHTHFHILVCNTNISTGKQISMSKSDLQRFKEHCSSVFRELGLKPVEKLDKSDEVPEINEDLFPKELTKEEQVKILFDDEPKPTTRRPYYGNNASTPSYVNNTVNVIIPFETQGTVYQGRNGTYNVSFKPYLPPVNNLQQNNRDFGSTDVRTQQFPEPQVSSEWPDAEPDWVKGENVHSVSPVISDGLVDPIVIVTEAKAEVEVEAAVVGEVEGEADVEADYETEYEAENDYEADYGTEYEADYEDEAEPKTQQLIDPFVILADPFVILKE